MKGLVRAAPTIERVQVGSRSARKHYGFSSNNKYDPSKGHLLSEWYAYMLLVSFALTSETANGIHIRVTVHRVS